MSDDRIKAITDACMIGVASFDPDVLWWGRVFDILTGILVALGMVGGLFILLWVMANVAAAEAKR